MASLSKDGLQKLMAALFGMSLLQKLSYSQAEGCRVPLSGLIHKKGGLNNYLYYFGAGVLIVIKV